MAELIPGKQYRITHQGIVYDRKQEQWLIVKESVIEHVEDCGNGVHKFKLISGRLEAHFADSKEVEITIRTNIWCGNFTAV